MTEHPTTTLELAERPTEPDERDTLRLVGNATTLLHCGGITVLTDPVFVHRHEEVDIGYGMHARRLLDPVLEFDDLPPVDLVVLSHLHGDHFDRVARERLPRDLPVLTTPEAAATLREWGFRAVHGVETWNTVRVVRGEEQLDVTAVPARHGPPGANLVLPDVMGSVLEWSSAGRRHGLYVTGDTLVIDDLTEVQERWPDLDVGLWHLGGTRVLGVLVTMDAEQGVELMRRVRPRRVVPVHHEDFDVFTSSLEDFLDAAERAGLRDRVAVVPRGGRFRVAPEAASEGSPEWRPARAGEDPFPTATAPRRRTTESTPETPGAGEDTVEAGAATMPSDDLPGSAHQQTQPLTPDGTPTPIADDGTLLPPTEEQMPPGGPRR